MSGLYRGGRAAERHDRRVRDERQEWRNVRDGIASAGTLAGFSGFAVLGWAPVGYAYLALALIVAAGLLLLCATAAGIKVRRLAEPQPPAMGTRQVRYHIDDAPTVHVGPRRRL